MYDAENKAFIYHIGTHSCSAKEENISSTEIVKKAVGNNSTVKPTEIQTMTILSDLRSRKNWNEVEKMQ